MALIFFVARAPAALARDISMLCRSAKKSMKNLCILSIAIYPGM